MCEKSKPTSTEPAGLRLAVIGSRSLKPDVLPRMRDRLEALLDQFPITGLVSGGAPGADRLAEELARELNIPIQVFPAEWDRHGRKAGPLRNEQIAQAADLYLAVVDKPLHLSRGTAHCVSRFHSLGKQGWTLNVNEEGADEA